MLDKYTPCTCTPSRTQRVHTDCGIYWNEISDKLAKEGAMKNMSETSYSNLLLSSHEIISILEKNVYKQSEKSKFTIPSCSSCLARVLYKYI